MKSAGLAVPLDALTDTLTVGRAPAPGDRACSLPRREARSCSTSPPRCSLRSRPRSSTPRLRALAEGGSTVAVVTHRLDEVGRFADRVSVMRRGRLVLSRPHARGSDSGDELTRAIMGGEPPLPSCLPRSRARRRRCWRSSGSRSPTAEGTGCSTGVDLEVRAGEIVGVAGVEGNGQRELVRAIAGLEPRATGSVRIGGRDLAALPVRARRSVLGVVHEDRHEEGLLLDASVGDNLILGDLGDGEPSFDEKSLIARRIERFRVQPPDASRLAGELSGGNQQKLVLARALDRLKAGARAAVVLAQPTRGVDVGAAAAIHAAIGEAAASGLAVLVVSADLSELRRLSHRIVVMRRGALVASLPPDASETTIGRAMLGMEAA
jgi:ABC-type uncharacterized transport system ATPase subunit